ncbi:bifunctional diaminohydroxyphosphoribosylaminopyrimidine deaminase/5-amino-6-(5-phosphoribosylamino)uracil reductase RibD [Alphaproteobacteria bacterium]|nr:bifunctional diaminohydroxyphosphoribosylaminopyrimidine deaminase/5-amino-6-(5-phosphoribosylamino)uracil reductase RibD [Alphaproteobacteria bacterium]
MAEKLDFWSNPVFPEDARWMRAAIMAAKRGIGRSGVNPPVGCVLISAGGQLLASGHTGAGGVPHAESVALTNLDAAGRIALQGGTAYVTLEPCAHHGKTPPCADALIAAGIARLVVALQDPDPRVNGNGLAQIAEKGIIVCLGVEAALSNESLRYFIHKIQTHKPYCSLKIASSLDGKIALSDRKKRWLTSPKMRRYVHFLRSQADAIITGIGTVLADDPKLNCRNEGLENDSPPIFIFDRLLRIPTTAAVLQSPYPVTLFCGNMASKQRRQVLGDAGCVIVPLPDDADGRPDIGAALHYMGARGVNHALVEAGSGLVTSFLAADAVNCIYWTQSDHILGGNSLPAVGQFESQTINAVATFAENRYIQTHYQAIGCDRLIILQKPSANTGGTQA